MNGHRPLPCAKARTFRISEFFLRFSPTAKTLSEPKGLGHSTVRSGTVHSPSALVNLTSISDLSKLGLALSLAGASSFFFNGLLTKVRRTIGAPRGVRERVMQIGLF